MLDAKVKAQREDRENMVVRKKTVPAPVKRTRAAAPVAAPVKRVARKAAPVAAPVKAGPDVTRYASVDAITDYHKALARWIVSEVGYDPDSAPSKKIAFLRGVAIATVARRAFQESDYIEEWRAKNGINKRGPKPAVAEVEEAPPARKRRAAPEPEPEVEEEFEEEDFEEAEDEEDAEAEDFEEEEEEEEFEDEEDAEEEDFEEPEPAPAPRKRAAAKAAPAPTKRAPAKKTATPAPAKRGRPAAAAPADDEDFAF